jgi:chromosome segregation ATPase
MTFWEIERLRAERDELRHTLDCIPNSILKAQDEIKRLRAGNEKLKIEVWHLQAVNGALKVVFGYTGEQIEGMAAEIERLSAQRDELLTALKKIIAVVPDFGTYETVNPFEMCEIARAAIAKVEVVESNEM